MNATARNGDEWTGEQPEEGWWPYLDTAGRRYESREVPAYRIVMDRAEVRVVNGRRSIGPIDAVAKASCDASTIKTDHLHYFGNDIWSSQEQHPDR